MRYSWISFLLFVLLGFVNALSSGGSRLLVVIDDPAEKDKYSKFWSDLQGRGFNVDFKAPKSDPELFKHGERTYDHILILPSRLKALGPALTPNILLDFVKNNGNILLALSSATSTPTSLVSLLLEFDINLPTDRDALLVDHFNYDTLSAKEKHDTIVTPPPQSLRSDIKNYFSGEGLLALPKVVPQVLGNGPLLNPILKAPNTAYSYNPSEEVDAVEELFATGQQLCLASAMQARNAARFTVLGSAEMLENTWFDSSVQRPQDKKQAQTSNREFAAKVTAWTFKELGVLKVGEVRHYLSEGRGTTPLNSTSYAQLDLNPKIYRIKNDVTFSIELSEYSQTKYIPYQPPASDNVQLEFTMLSPYQRLSLQPISRTANSTIYATSFTLPDQHGIFSFRVNYKRPFLTVVEEKRHVTVRHFAHNEWPRSWRISGAWVWITGIWATVAGWLAFVALWLFSEPTDEARRVKKTN